MHFFHPTPLNIVEQYIASRIKGKYFEKVLDPCVGDGALLTSLENNFNSITIIDIDSEKLNNFSDKNFIKHCGDFLDLEIDKNFDLILCNPPFNNKSISGQSIEEKFLKKCLKLIINNGYGIFILPSSIINGTKSKKIREFIVKNYTILSIDILPKKTFNKIESHFYIIILKSTPPSNNYNFETNIGNFNINSIIKNDYATLNPKYLFSLLKYEKLLKKIPTFKLSKENLFRGNTEKNFFPLHTTHFSSFFCNINFYHEKKANDKYIKKYDLLCKRVGRDCHNSFSIFLSERETNLSDCIIVIPSTSNNLRYNLINLLNIRLSILFGASSNFLIDGSGANYIPIKKLKQTNFLNFKEYLSKKDIKKFFYLLRKKDIKSLVSFEKKLREKILKNIKNL
ncbi:methyltransferase [Acinetobacter pittii]|uniref:methyltransferase n=1 Tax=Acinetobacter pittii TaxID=48296 RepID=UPI000D3C20B5|nr:methyltransferase [Acinetobacter pittii]PTV50782.1 SAM-dependent methyltransferase [Acinetobacter pittii]